MNPVRFLILGFLVLGLSACGNKGKLKSPSQIEEAQAKKQAKADKKARESGDDELSVMQTVGPESKPQTGTSPAKR